MKAFADLLDRLVFTPQRNAKLRLLRQYFRNVPDSDRGYGLGALTGTLSFPHAKPALIRDLANTRLDPVLYAMSYDFVGDLAETTALMWPGVAAEAPSPPLSAVVTALRSARKTEVPALVAAWLDLLDASGRFALLKLITGGLRAGVSARLTKVALAEYGRVPVAEVEEVWHGLTPPYPALFAWLEGRGGRPEPVQGGTFRPLMLATPLDDGDIHGLDPADYVAEWKWDGIRVQLAGGDASTRVFSRSGDDISAAFPDISACAGLDAVLDGELLVVRDGVVAPFNDLQQRLGRKAVTPAMRQRFPCHVRLYDILIDGERDVRDLPLAARRRRLEEWFARTRPGNMDLSPIVPFKGWDEVLELRRTARSAAIEGLMLKRTDSAYVAGRPRGPWFKLKRDALTVDCVLMYAQRGHGKRSSYYSDYTFGCWRSNGGGGADLVPVGKAYSGFTDAELVELDRWVRAHTVERFGPVRSVTPGLVLEIAFDSVHRSARHKSGVAMRFPRVHRIRWDKPADEADTLDRLTDLIDHGAGAGAAEPRVAVQMQGTR